MKPPSADALADATRLVEALAGALEAGVEATILSSLNAIMLSITCTSYTRRRNNHIFVNVVSIIFLFATL